MKPMEENLSLTVRDLLAAMQHRIMTSSRYFGVPTLKCPLDMWIYQEIVAELQPDIIIEVGVYCGGATLALAHMLDVLGNGMIIGVDVDLHRVPSIVRQHARIRLLAGDACSMIGSVEQIVDNVHRDISDSAKVLVIEDSSHSYEGTLSVLNAYSKLVTPGSYLIVEDGICHHGLDVGPCPGPYEAIGTFTKSNVEFEIDRAREAFLITWNPTGFLRRTR